MIIRTVSGDREVRAASWPDNTIPPRPAVAPAASGESVSPARAVGLPAFGAAVRKVSGVIAAAKLDVFSGEGAKKRERPDSWQAKLFEQPAEDLSRFDWLWDIASSLEVYENAILQKIKTGSRVVELRPLPMDYVAIYRDRKTQRKVIEINDGTSWKKYGPDDILHIRGQTLGSGVAGVSKVSQHRDPLGAMLAAQRFEGNYFRNHARPDVAFIFPETVTREQADEWRPYIDSVYGGAQNFGKPIPIGGGVQIQPIPINLRDAQFIEARQLSVEDVARIMDVHGLLLEGSTQRLQGDALQAALDIFMHLQMPPRLRRITDALKADPDLFGRGILYPEICIDELSFLDPLTRAQVEHQRVQDGTQLVDEVRASHGWAPLPPIPEDPSQTPGMVPQLTPVGGQANPNVEPADNGDSETSGSRGLTMPSVELRLEQDMEPLAREMGLAFSSMADALGRFGEMAADLQKRAADIEQQREKRAVAHEQRAAAEHDALVGALERASSPSVTVNVEPTPVQITNQIDVQPAEVQMTLLDDDSAPLDVTFQRNPNGTIKSARITEGA